jgi:anti-sigma regulatory factor (Ser/Thr protein kinase)
MTVTVDIPRDPTAPAAARRAIQGLSGRVADDVIPDVKLLVSELVTNSVKYGGDGALRLQIETEGPRKLRAEVIDQGVGFVPVARDRPATEVGGWGLHLVQTLSNRWASTRARPTCGSRSSTDARRARLATGPSGHSTSLVAAEVPGARRS